MFIQKQYSRAFKVQTVKLVIEEGLIAKEVSNTIEVYHVSVCLWVSQCEKYGAKLFRKR